MLDPALVPSGSHLWWSGSGNDFGCPPDAGHNLDLALPAVPAGTQKLTLTFKSRWDIEWDFDYGFVLSTHRQRQDLQVVSVGQGLHDRRRPRTRTPTAARAPTATVSRARAAPTRPARRPSTGSPAHYPAAPFVDDEYDITDLIGKPGAVLRFSYATDPGLARPGWFMDDVVIKADDNVIYSSDFETRGRRGAVQRRLPRDRWPPRSAARPAGSTSPPARTRPAEHAYLLEMRDRSGFDAHGQGESDRGDLTFASGVLLAYTDEDHGYGNVGTDNPPAQTPLDSRPEPGSDTPNLDDAAFKAGDAFSDGGAGHTDNYTDDERRPWVLKYGCLAFTVDRLAGTGVGPEVAGALRPRRRRHVHDDRELRAASTTATARTSAGQPVAAAGHAAGAGAQAGRGAGTPPAAAPPAAGHDDEGQAAVCKARGARARGPLRSFRDAVPDVRGQGADASRSGSRRGARVRVDLMKGRKIVRRVLSSRAPARRRAPTRCA